MTYNKKDKFLFPKLKQVPIEIYVLVIPALLLSIVVFTCTESILRLDPLTILENSIGFTSLLGGHKFFIAFASLWIIIGLLTLRNYKQTCNQLNVRAIGTLAGTTLLFSTVGIITGMSTLLIYYSVPEVTALKSTLFLDTIERNLFGDLPATLFIKIFNGTFFEILFLYSYHYLFLVFSFTLILAAFKNKIMLRKMMISFFVAFILSIPIWMLVPATSPDGLYVANVFNLEKTDNLDYQSTSVIFQKFNSFYHRVWIDDDNNRINISSFPSLHAAWGLIVIWAIYRIKRRFFPIAAFWFLFEIIGAFYSLQHYFIDLIMGILFGAIAILFTEVIINFEKKYYTGLDYYSFCEILDKITFKPQIPHDSTVNSSLDKV
ncbi:MAG: phosphatase PAP2 family protein [Candidatus Pacebacteria bacterium]|nr:phosphatase PAP2 family protein [Candidatus Paceibacterota bacterium]